MEFPLNRNDLSNLNTTGTKDVFYTDEEMTEFNIPPNMIIENNLKKKNTNCKNEIKEKNKVECCSDDSAKSDKSFIFDLPETLIEKYKTILNYINISFSKEYIEFYMPKFDDTKIDDSYIILLDRAIIKGLENHVEELIEQNYNLQNEISKLKQALNPIIDNKRLCQTM